MTPEREIRDARILVEPPLGNVRTVHRTLGDERVQFVRESSESHEFWPIHHRSIATHRLRDFCAQALRMLLVEVDELPVRPHRAHELVLCMPVHGFPGEHIGQPRCERAPVGLAARQLDFGGQSCSDCREPVAVEAIDNRLLVRKELVNRGHRHFGFGCHMIVREALDPAGLEHTQSCIQNALYHVTRARLGGFAFWREGQAFGHERYSLRNGHERMIAGGGRAG